MYNAFTVIGTARPKDTGFIIELLDAYRPGLLGLDGFSHATIYWLAHEANAGISEPEMVLASPYSASEKAIGLFATRSPERPSPICASVIAIGAVNTSQGVLSTPFIDAMPETPVVDIKPYFPASDRVKSATTPGHFSHWPEWFEDSASFNWKNEFNF